MQEGKILGGTAIKPVERHGMEAVKYFLYNKDTGEYCTRTPKSWLLITIFYVIYYSCLAAFWALMLAVFYQTLSYDEPKWIGSNGIIGVSPGLGLRPLQPESLIESSIILVDKNSKDGDSGWGGWAERSDAFLEPYRNSSDLKSCTKADPSTNEQACQYDSALLGPCGEEGHGYEDGKPCIFLKLNKIFGVSNDFYNDINDLPEDMPDQLKKHIESVADKDQVWVDCRPVYPADIEAVSAISYFPADRGFPAMYFPYTKQENYLSPLVAVQFETTNFGQLIHLECRAWAKNIDYSRRDRIGIAHLEIMVLSES